jgi:pseudouridylate synthase
LIELRSGRRHQIRQHFAGIQHPLLGDEKYHPRAASALLKRPALHACEMTCAQAMNTIEQRPMKVVISCALPSDMREALCALRGAATPPQGLA